MKEVMPIKNVLDGLFEGPCDLPTLCERTSLDGKDLQKMLQTLAEMKNVKCERRGTQIIWSLTPEMEESMEKRGADDRAIKGVENDLRQSDAAAVRRGPIGRRQKNEIVVAPFIPARAEISIYRTDDLIVIKSSLGSEKESVGIPVERIEDLMQALSKLKTEDAPA